MKEHIRLFDTPQSADLYEINNIPWIGTIKSSGQNVRATAQRTLFNIEGEINISPLTVILTLNDDSVIYIKVENPVKSTISSYKSTTKSAEIKQVISAVPASFFENFTNLRTVSFSKNITAIESNAFKGCSSLTEVTIPSNITRIESTAFSSVQTFVIEKLQTLYKGFGTPTNVTIRSVDSSVDYSTYDVATKIFGLTSASTGTKNLYTEDQALITALTNSMSDYNSNLIINVYDLSNNKTTTIQGAKSTFLFYIEGVPYQAEVGMNWYEWVNSSYNTGNFTTYHDYDYLDIVTDFTIERYISEDKLNSSGYQNGGVIN